MAESNVGHKVCRPGDLVIKNQFPKDEVYVHALYPRVRHQTP